MAVSSTSIKGFSVQKNLAGMDTPNDLLFIIDNSQTISVGDAVRLDTAGYLKRCAAGDPAVLGICVGLYDQSGNMAVMSPRIPAAAISGATLTFDDTLATASDNTSNLVKKLSALVTLDPAGNVLWRNVASGALTQANVGSMFNVTSTNSGQIDQATASTTSGQFQLLQLDPDGDGSTSKGLFRIVQNQLVQNFKSYNSSAVITA